MTKTYCINSNCPFTDCEKHLTKVKSETNNHVYVASVDGVCRQYLSYLLDSIQENNNEEKYRT